MLADNYNYGRMLQVIMALDKAYEDYEGLEKILKANEEDDKEYVKYRFEYYMKGMENIKWGVEVDDNINKGLNEIKKKLENETV